MTIEELLVKTGRWPDSRGPRTGKIIKGAVWSGSWEVPFANCEIDWDLIHSMGNEPIECKLTTVPCADDEKGVCV